MESEVEVVEKDEVNQTHPVKDADVAVPPFVQIVAATSNAFGRGAEDVLSSDHLYGLDQKGRVWEWVISDPERKGSGDGWMLLPNAVYKDGEEPAMKRATR
jgi:hypothetical protein